MDQIAPKKVNSFRILEPLSHGPHAVSYKGYDPDSEKEVVLKLVNPAMSDRLAFRGPGQTLIRNLSALSLPEIVPVEEISRFEDCVVIVRPFVDGNSLKSQSEFGKLEKDLFVLQAQRIVVALTAIHHEKMLHGNLREGNILFDLNDDVVFADYGLLTGFSLDDLDPEEEASEWLQYLPPELIWGRELGRHTDLYALGVIFFHMITGIYPFGSGTNRLISDRIRAGVNAREALHESEIGGDCVLLIEKLLAVNPEERFNSAHELLVTLDEISLQSSRPESSPPHDPSRFAPPRVYILVSAAFVIFAILWILFTGPR